LYIWAYFFLIINDDSNRAQENEVGAKLDQRMSTDSLLDEMSVTGVTCRY